MKRECLNRHNYGLGILAVCLSLALNVSAQTRSGSTSGSYSNT